MSTDLQQRTLKAAQRYAAGKEMITSIFDESQHVVFKELLPYWTAFSRSWAAMALEDDKALPPPPGMLVNIRIPNSEHAASEQHINLRVRVRVFVTLICNIYTGTGRVQ